MRLSALYTVEHSTQLALQKNLQHAQRLCGIPRASRCKAPYVWRTALSKHASARDNAAKCAWQPERLADADVC
jgi:hypothetical protein